MNHFPAVEQGHSIIRDGDGILIAATLVGLLFQGLDPE